MKWHKNTSFFSVVIAGLALVLSQFPPIRSWIPHTNLQIQCAEKLGIINELGFIGYGLFLELDNDGNTLIEVEEISLKIKSPSNQINVYKAKSLATISGSSISPYFPVTALEVKENERWLGAVNFRKKISSTEDEIFYKMKLKVSKDISDKWQNKSWEDENPNSNVEISAESAYEVNNFFKSNFDLRKGQYEGTLEIKVKGKSKPFTYNFRYDIFEYHFEIFKAQLSDYKYGYGIIFPILREKKVYVTISDNRLIDN